MNAPLILHGRVRLHRAEDDRDQPQTYPIDTAPNDVIFACVRCGYERTALRWRLRTEKVLKRYKGLRPDPPAQCRCGSYDFREVKPRDG